MSIVEFSKGADELFNLLMPLVGLMGIMLVFIGVAALIIFLILMLFFGFCTPKR